jgi:hypothetical protein
MQFLILFLREDFFYVYLYFLFFFCFFLPSLDFRVKIIFKGVKL